jgi:adenylate kinase
MLLSIAAARSSSAARLTAAVAARAWPRARASLARCLSRGLAAAAPAATAAPEAAAKQVAADLHGDSTATAVASCPTQARALFEDVWEEVTRARAVGELAFPREVVWLTGAPGAGKGTMADVIKRERDIVKQFEVSSLLQTPEFARRKEQGLLIGDRDVVLSVVRELLKPEYRGGVIVDGYPRTETQAHAIRLLRDKLEELWSEHRAHPELRRVLRRPNFSITCFYCSEEESVKRQMHRGEELARLNKMVADTGVGRATAARATDLSPEAARTRYRIFREEVYGSLQAVKSHLAFHFINADGDTDSVKAQLRREFKYQSSFDLGDEVHSIVRAVPSAAAIIRQARSSLVQRLAGYSMDHPELFAKVVQLLQADFVPLLRRCVSATPPLPRALPAANPASPPPPPPRYPRAAVPLPSLRAPRSQSLAGAAVVRSVSPLLEMPESINMALDVLAERGYTVVLDVMRERVPVRIDAATGAIESRSSKVFVFRISFPKPEIRSNEG